MRKSFLVMLALALSTANAGPLLVLSVDGLDHRYLRDADKLGLKIPNLRRLVREGQWAASGVVGVVPTVTWPSHTTLISGVPPVEHGILGNKRPKSEGGEYYWSVDLLKVPTLLNAMRAAGRKSGAITWPVTVDAPVDFNLPEYFRGRNGGAMDLPSIESKSTPGLVAEIASRYPSFTTQWMDDRTRAIATKFLLEVKRPDLLLVHLVDHDSEAHHMGPFTREALAMIEYTDELIGDILRVLPKEYTVAVVSDHGFERTERAVKLPTLPGLTVSTWLAVASTPESADRMRELRRDPASGIGREVPGEEVRRLAPRDHPNAIAAWEPAEHVSFAPAGEKGNHGLWPTRTDYRSVFVLRGPGIRAERLPEIPMTSIAGRFAQVLDVKWPMARP